MVILAYLIIILLIFFPALGFVFLKSSGKETRHAHPIRRTQTCLFALQLLGFVCAAGMFLTIGIFESEKITTFSFYILYAIDIAAFMLIFTIPEHYYADPVLARLLQTYIILLIFLILTGIILAPYLGFLSR